MWEGGGDTTPTWHWGTIAAPIPASSPRRRHTRPCRRRRINRTHGSGNVAGRSTRRMGLGGPALWLVVAPGPLALLREQRGQGGVGAWRRLGHHAWLGFLGESADEEEWRPPGVCASVTPGIHLYFELHCCLQNGFIFDHGECRNSLVIAYTTLARSGIKKQQQFCTNKTKTRRPVCGMYDYACETEVTTLPEGGFFAWKTAKIIN